MAMIYPKRRLVRKIVVSQDDVPMMLIGKQIKIKGPLDFNYVEKCVMQLVIVLYLH